MRTREEIETELFEIYDGVETVKNELDDSERELSRLLDVLIELEAELSALDESEGEDE
ncbi:MULTISPECIES: hypothetical protein [Bacillus]|uniref:hypothetical protein n=1 Tax=Bacillus TaxID=1386 RepID=UPI000AEECFF9|nr:MULTISPECIES: hypothetical protein [Bacillus]UTV31996.1 hypothetical protein NM966_14600 [Bacillus altitudinis]